MKTLLKPLSAIICTISVLACNKENISVKCNGPGEDAIKAKDNVECIFNLEGINNFTQAQTRAKGLESDASGTLEEKKIHSLQLFVFGNDGILTEAKKTSESSIKLTLPSGEGYSFYAVANTENFISSVAKTSDLENKVTSLLNTAEGGNRFAMSGKLTGQTVSASRQSFTIPIKRLAAKVVLRKITNNLPGATGDITLVGIYLSNIPTSAKVFGNGTPSSSIYANNSVELQKLSSFDWFTDKFYSPLTITKGTSYETAHTFYTYANTGTNPTRLVLITKIQGKIYYYPITFGKDFPALTANKYINITELSISHLGTDNPEKTVTKESIEIKWMIENWDMTDNSYDY